tara:strand:- start:1094 stop:2344 length:1251 start_codon:yes stop_codon:yes gene_type:complete
MNKVKYLVLGGGVSGLSFANFVEDDYIILEKESQPGGYCKTIHKDGFTWDYAGHFFHFRDKEIESFFKERLGDVRMVEKEKSTNIYIDDSYIDFPFQKNIHQLSKENFIDCIHDLILKEEIENPENFEEMLYSKFGKSITDLFLKPYNEKLYAVDLNQLDVDAMGRFFPFADVKEIVSNFKNTNNDSYNNKFHYPVKGAYVFIEALLSTLDSNKLKLNESVLDIDIDKKEVTTEHGKISYEYLISSIPLDKLLNLASIEVEKGILSSNQVLTFNLGFNKPELIPVGTHWTYIPEKNINFYRMGYYSNILDESKLSMYVELGFKSDEKFDIDIELSNVLEGLKKIGVIDDTYVLESYEPIVMNPAYVHISKESEELKNKMFKILESNDVYSIGRYGSWTYCSIEDNVIQAKKLSGLI